MPNGHLVSGSVKQGKSRKAPLTSDNGNRSKFSGGNDDDLFSHTANMCVCTEEFPFLNDNYILILKLMITSFPILNDKYYCH